jgi:hypothetical protein
MKKIITSLILAIVLFSSCRKETTLPDMNLPWQFTLTDSSAGKAYNYNAQTYQQGYNRNYPFFECSGSSDSTARFDMSANVTAVLQNTNTINISITLTSLIDTLKSRKLAKGNLLVIKQNTLKEIYAPGRILAASNNLLQQPLWFSCYYTAETGARYTTNFLNLVPTDFIKINSSEIWDDGSGIAKIKVTLEYNCHVQGYISGSGWSPEIKKISGTMQTFFTVQ